MGPLKVPYDLRLQNHPEVLEEGLGLFLHPDLGDLADKDLYRKRLEGVQAIAHYNFLFIDKDIQIDHQFLEVFVLKVKLELLLGGLKILGSDFGVLPLSLLWSSCPLYFWHRSWHEISLQKIIFTTLLNLLGDSWHMDSPLIQPRNLINYLILILSNCFVDGSDVHEELPALIGPGLLQVLKTHQFLLEEKRVELVQLWVLLLLLKKGLSPVSLDRLFVQINSLLLLLGKKFLLSFLLLLML